MSDGLHFPVNNFLVEVQAVQDAVSTRTDALPILEGVATPVVKYLKTGAH